MAIQTDQAVLVLPNWFDERAECEMESKGYFGGASVHTVDGSRFSVFFYDPVRLTQDLQEESSHGRAFIAEPGLIVVPEVRRAVMEAAVERLWVQGYFKHLNPVAGGEVAHAWPVIQQGSVT